MNIFIAWDKIYNSIPIEYVIAPSVLIAAITAPIVFLRVKEENDDFSMIMVSCLMTAASAFCTVVVLAGVVKFLPYTICVIVGLSIFAVFWRAYGKKFLAFFGIN